VNFFTNSGVSMDVNDPQCRYVLQSCYAALEVIRRRLKGNDGEVAHMVLKLMLQPVSKAQQGEPAKKKCSWIPPQHIQVIQKYAQGRNLTEIASEEKSSRAAILRILRTAPFTVLEWCGVIESES
jgi:hypothetical protein